MKTELSKIEKAVLEKLIEGSIPLLTELRKQFDVCTVKDREFTGVGFFTYFSVPEETHKKVGLNLVLGDVFGDDIPELQRGAGFMLFIEDGILTCLEGYSYEEPWPTQVDEFRLTYFNTHDNDLLSPATSRDWTALEKLINDTEGKLT